MGKLTHEQKLKIIAKHKGERLTAVIANDEKILIKKGPLSKVDKSSIVLKDAPLYQGQDSIPFEQDGQKKILHLYNRVMVDLIDLREAFPLNKMLKDKELEPRVLKSLRRKLNEKLFFVHRRKQELAVVSAVFTDMGIMGIIAKPGPFFNIEETLPYDGVLHIYDENYIDYINPVTMRSGR